RRNLRQRFARYELGDFKLEKDEMERTATATLEMRGGVKLRRDGAHEIQISKTMRRVSNTPNEWIFTSVSQANPYEPLMTETTHIILPPEATNIRHVGAGTANHALVYDVPPTGGSKRGLLFSGMAILGVGLALAAAGYLPRKDPRRRS
ncbi:MAG TPA: hypothetical protein VHF69_12590, partial [Candidatus Synoicihabitans sp.]|nr:hypothetical protein [Candidatus Synoicihabitans sp.]